MTIWMRIQKLAMAICLAVGVAALDKDILRLVSEAFA